MYKIKESILNTYGFLLDSQFENQEELDLYIDDVVKAFKGEYCREKSSDVSVFIIKFIIEIDLILSRVVFHEKKRDCRLALVELINDLILKSVQENSLQLKEERWNVEKIKCLIERMDDNDELKEIAVPAHLGYEEHSQAKMHSYLWSEDNECRYDLVDVLIKGEMKQLIKFSFLEQTLQGVSSAELDDWRILFNNFQQYYGDKENLLKQHNILEILSSIGISVKEILSCNSKIDSLMVLSWHPEEVKALIEKGFAAKDLLSHSFPGRNLECLISNYKIVVELIGRGAFTKEELIDLDCKALNQIIHQEEARQVVHQEEAGPVIHQEEAEPVIHQGEAEPVIHQEEAGAIGKRNIPLKTASNVGPSIRNNTNGTTESNFLTRNFAYIFSGIVATLLISCMLYFYGKRIFNSVSSDNTIIKPLNTGYRLFNSYINSERSR
jgi:hypothetical protein